MEKYSVLMAVYEKEKPEYLAQSLKSMLAQTVPPDEIVLVEDGPLNCGLYHVIQSYKEHFPGQIQTVALAQNSGLGRALNYGLSFCRNDLVARMDSDDLSLPKRCEMQLRAFLRNPQLAIVGTQMDEFFLSPHHIVSVRAVPCAYRDILRFSRRRSPFNHPTVMFRKSVVVQLGGYGAYERKEDLDLFLRMLQEGYLAYNLKRSYLLYRTDITNLRRRKRWINCKEYVQIMYRFHRKGYNSVADMIYVAAGQMVMYLAPEKLTQVLSSCFLRKRKRYEK